MKLLLDTNVLIAALVARGTCSDLVDHCVRHHTVISSQALLDELRSVLERKFRQRPIDARAAIQLFSGSFTIVMQEVLDSPVCRDLDDDVVLATAVKGECAAIITGDEDLLILDPFRDIRILRPSAFWSWEARG